MLMTKKYAHGTRGFTLTEAAIVLGIVGLILGAIWAAAASVYQNMKINDAEKGITLTAQQVHAMFAGSNNTGTAADTDITTAGMFPISWYNTTTNIYGNPWNISQAANTSRVTGNGNLIAIEIWDIPEAGCAALVNYFNQAAATANGGNITGLVGTAVVNGAGTPVGAAAAGFVASPVGVCQPGNINAVAITFDMRQM